MRRADRLFQVVQLLRTRTVVTARQLADELRVSERTVYRDIQHLSSAGVPIEGEAGVGYRLRGYDLPPLHFGRIEIEALALGLRVVASWTDDELASAARSALGKVEAVLPDGRSGQVRETALFAPPLTDQPPIAIDLPSLRSAIRERRKIHIEYRDASGRTSERTVRPFGLAFYGWVWVMAAWCELRQDYRAFRPDRMVTLEVLDEVFELAVEAPSMDGYLRYVTRRSDDGGSDDSCHGDQPGSP
ncbi:MAG: YafY family protein [Acidobacteriota bacterium]